MTAFRWGSVSDTGRVRTNNQDSALVAEELNLFVVADGMGGHQGGEVASGLAVTAMREHYAEATTDSLVESVQLANRIVYDRAAEDPDLRGMGTTLCALALVSNDDDHDDEELLAIVNVGDSRVYRFESGELLQVSEDHSLVEGMVREGRLSAEDAITHPQRNILTRALGIDAELEVDCWEVTPYAGDRWLLCSDGLFNEVDEDRIAATLRRLADPGEAARELVRLANEGGGRDNITAVVVDVVDDGGRSRTASAAVAAEAGSPRVAGAGAASTAPVESRGGRGGHADPSVADRPVEDRDDAQTEDGKHRRVTWRVVLFVVLLLVTVGAAAAAVGWYGRNTYFVAFDDEDVVTIYKGRPGGLLWFDPTVAERSDLERADVPPAVVGDLEPGKDQATLGAAQRYVENLEEQSARLRPSTTTTTSTTATTVPAPTPTTISP